MAACLKYTAGHDVVAAGFAAAPEHLDDTILCAVAREQRRVMITHNVDDVPDILRAWAEAGRSHHGCILSFLPPNAYGEMGRRFDGWFRQFPFPGDWIDRVCASDLQHWPILWQLPQALSRSKASADQNWATS